jgi:hypothetical protein
MKEFFRGKENNIVQKFRFTKRANFLVEKELMSN